MKAAIKLAKRVVLILSPEYLRASPVHRRWKVTANANIQSKVLAVNICKSRDYPEELTSIFTTIDIVDKTEMEARELFLKQIKTASVYALPRMNSTDAYP